jgi:hypothetical protein
MGSPYPSECWAAGYPSGLLFGATLGGYPLGSAERTPARRYRPPGSRLRFWPDTSTRGATGGRPPSSGDFNCKPGSAPYEVFREHGFTDTFLAAGNTDDGDAYTFHAFKGSSFKPSDTDKPFGRIDWILLRDTAGRFGVVGHQIPRDADEEAGLYPSDPYPAFVDLSISE